MDNLLVDNIDNLTLDSLIPSNNTGKVQTIDKRQHCLKITDR